MRSLQLALVGVVLAVAAGCTAAPASVSSPPAATTSPTPTLAPSPSLVRPGITLVARTVPDPDGRHLHFKFTQTSVRIPAGRDFTILLRNPDHAEHNVWIADASGTDVFKGPNLFNSGERLYEVPALAAGTYRFYCNLHPIEMTGTLISE